MGCELTYDVGAMDGAMAKSRLPSGTGHCFTSGHRSMFYFRVHITVLLSGAGQCFTSGFIGKSVPFQNLTKLL